MYFADLLTFESPKIGPFGEEGRKVGKTWGEQILFRQPDKCEGLCRKKLGKPKDGSFSELIGKENRGGDVGIGLCGGSLSVKPWRKCSFLKLVCLPLFKCIFYEIRAHVHQLSRFLYFCHPHQLFVCLFLKTSSSLIAKNECFLFLQEITLEKSPSCHFLGLGFILVNKAKMKHTLLNPFQS